ncbi:MAG: RNA polymerase sigma-I factor [Clostridiales bacterium GWC2_40_7]|nr:MAG: RNA polymerase sigma-I factor [Clostridiales bacterium GWC2_40_7]
MQVADINARIAAIKNNDEEINRFVDEYKPFIASCTEKLAGRYVRYGEDDELSIAMMGFVEAIKAFDGTKGNFLSFSQNVIKRRLIDYYRKEKRHSNVISLNTYMGEDNEEYDLSSGESLEKYAQDRLGEYRRLELEQLGRELSEYEITFFDLASVSPKQDRTHKICNDIAGFLLSRPDLIKLIKEKRYLPIAEIINALKVPRKIVERSRKYIIAVVIIATGDYQYIRDYVNIGGKGVR